MRQISVIIPCLNCERYIAETIGSIAAQPYADLEIILVDNGCSDRSVEIAQQCDRQVRVVSQPIKGIAAARIAGLKAARGKLIAFCDADDLWVKNRLPSQLAHFEEDETAISCGLTQTFLSPELNRPGVAEKCTPPVYFRIFGAMLMHRDIVERIGELPLHGADLTIAFVAACADQGITIRQLDDVVMLRRSHDSNFSRTGGLQFANYAQSLKGVLDRRRTLAEQGGIASPQRD